MKARAHVLSWHHGSSKCAKVWRSWTSALADIEFRSYICSRKAGSFATIDISDVSEECKSFLVLVDGLSNVNVSKLPAMTYSQWAHEDFNAARISAIYMFWIIWEVGSWLTYHLMSSTGFSQFKSRDALRLCKGVGGDQDVFSGLSWGTNPDTPSGNITDPD